MGNLDPSSLTPGGPVVPLVCGFRRRYNLPASAPVVCEPLQLAFDFGRNTTTLRKFIGYTDLSDFCQIPLKHFRNNDKRKCVGKF